MERHGRLLLVEDEHSLRSLVAQFLRGARHQVVEARDGREGILRYEELGPFDLALIDLNLPYYTGVDVCRRIREVCPDQKILICSAAITAESERALRAMGVDHFLTKPYHPEALLAHIRVELEASRPAVVPHAVTAG
jgi:DNA-binding response OmpR family regulator